MCDKRAVWRVSQLLVVVFLRCVYCCNTKDVHERNVNGIYTDVKRTKISVSFENKSEKI